MIVMEDDDDDDDDDDEMLMTSFSSKGRHGCCFGSLSKPGRSLLEPSCSSPSSSSPCDWEKKIQSTADIKNKPRWWTRPLRKIRQFVAVHQLKTLIRLFRRNSSGGGGGGGGGERSGSGSEKFQYHPSGYCLNFGEGPGQNGHCRETDMGKFGISSPA